MAKDINGLAGVCEGRVDMNLRYSLADESYKYVHGIYDKYQGMDELDINEQEIALEVARNDWAAFQLLLKSDEDFTLSLRENPSFHRGPLNNVRIE